MPTVAVVEGVKIQFYPNDHPPPHFHAEFGEHRASIHIQSVRVLRGNLPDRKLRVVVEWASTRKAVLAETFIRAVARQRVEPIP